MNRVLLGLLFLSMMVLVVGGIHYYFWYRMAVVTSLTAPWRTAVKVAIISLAVSLPASFLLSRILPTSLSRYLLAPVFLWMGLFFLLFWLFLATDALRLFAWLWGRLSGSEAFAFRDERRQSLMRLVSGASVGVAFVTGGAAFYQALWHLKVKRLEITLQKLPAALDGLRLVQLTDLHLGSWLGRSFMERVVRLTNQLKPDLVAITGDLVDGSVERLRPATASLQQLNATFGVFFVTGNHEYYSGAIEWEAELKSLGLRVLRNERVEIRRGEAVFDLAGVDDYNAKGLAPGHAPDLPRALQGRDPQRAVVLLAHQPRAVEEAASLGVDLQLSGHTHGGQIWPMHHLVPFQQPYVRGLHNHKGCAIYVSHGTGFWGPPMRLGSTAEITEITLRSPHKTKKDNPPPHPNKPKA